MVFFLTPVREKVCISTSWWRISNWLYCWIWDT